MAFDMQSWRDLEAKRPAEAPQLRITWFDRHDEVGVPEALDHLAGDVRVLRDFPSAHLDHARDVWIYLPPGYDQAQDTAYPVLYMHDGNNLFDPQAAFGGQHWGVNETAEWMIQAGLLPPTIVVGPANTPERLAEYTWAPCERQGGGKGAAYGRFLADELKPYVDRTYRTLPGRAHTGVLGSSLGGLNSLYLGHHLGDVFGKVGAMSPSLWWSNRRVLQDLAALRDDLRLWLDMGCNEGQSEAESQAYLADVRAFKALLEARGYEVGRNLAHWEVPGADHSEAAWRNRVATAMMFLAAA